MINKEFDPGINISQAIGLILLRWQIVGVVIAATLLSGLLYMSPWSSEPVSVAPVPTPVYTATALYTVKISADSDMSASEVMRISIGMSETFRVLLSTQSVYAAVAALPEITMPADNIKHIVKVRNVPGTSLISVTAVDSDPDKALAISNNFATALSSMPYNGVITVGGASASLVEYEPESAASLVDLDPYAFDGSHSTFARLSLLIFIAVTLGLVSVFAIEQIEQRANWPSQVINGTGLNLITSLGSGSSSTSRNSDRCEIASDEYRYAKAHLIGAIPSANVGRSVLITSSGSGEGKTTVLENLAQAFAEDGSRVVVVSSDMRSERPIDILQDDTATSPGLSEYLTDESISTDDLLKHMPESGINLIRIGGSEKSAKSLIDSNRMKSLINDLKQRADWVLLDSPGILDSADAALLAPLTDGTLYVVDGSRTKLRDAQKGISLLERSGARMIGFIHNRVRRNLVARVMGQSVV